MVVSKNIVSPTDLTALHARGVHFVLCRDKDEGDKKAKSALASGWQKTAAPIKEVLAHHRAGGLLGFIPGRVGLWVLDVDKTPDDVDDIVAVLKRLGVVPLVTVTTKRTNGRHLYFKKENDGKVVRNRNWAIDGFSGEVRGDNGYCILWEPDKLADALDRLDAAEATPDSMFPRPAKTSSTAKGFAVGNRTNHLNAVVYAGTLRGETDFTKSREQAIQSGLPTGKVDDTIKKATADAGAVTDRTFEQKDATTLELVFEKLGWRVRYNLRSMRCDWSLDGGSTWGSTTDRMEKKLRRIIAETFSYRTVKDGKKITRPLVYGRDAWEEHVGAILADHEVDPFKLWLEGLPPWDGTKRLHRLLSDTFKAEDNPLTRWAAATLLLGPIQRCYEPGCKLDEVVVLVGKQGIGKSSILKRLLPPDEADSWFSDSLNMTDTLQKRAEALQGRVICELSDLQGFNRADLQSLKSFITRTDDGSTRMAYRRNPETTLRRSVLIGSSDRAECLPNDPAGLRRFVPIECREGCNVEQFMTANRAQVWGEALAIYRAGETRANLPRSLMRLQSDRAEDHRRKDQIVEDAVGGIDGEGPYTIKELCRMTHPETRMDDRRSVLRLADALKVGGWRKKRERDENGDHKYLWRLTDPS